MTFLVLAALLPLALPATPDAAQQEFFETKIRPILVDNCYACHSTKSPKIKGGLLLDSRAALLKGGDSGPAIVPGEPAKSRLIAAIKYGDIDLQMPPKGKLSEALIADLETWAKAGAVWPESVEAAQSVKNNFDLKARKQAHWCWQPIKPKPAPTVRDQTWSADPVDRFILAKLEAAGLKPSSAADDTALLRRLSFDLTGLPPTVAELAAFQAIENRQSKIENAVDRLLASPRFGERWARHWLDLVRYAETRGHEFDYPAPNAWQYRDYVIRALNADVPYDQFVREHVAGDLLPEPRRHPSAGFNESILGTGFWWLGEQVHSPVDLRLDEADRVDNQIDVFGKTFLGITLACARCHDHKFDAISTKDYYSFAAVLASCGYRQARFETQLDEQRLGRELAAWRVRVGAETKRRLAAILSTVKVDAPIKVTASAKRESVWTTIVDYESCRNEDWLPDGQAFVRLKPGDWLVGPKGWSVATEAAAYVDPAWFDRSTHPECQTDAGDLGKVDRAGKSLRTPEFTLNGQRIYCRVRGRGFVYVNVQSYGTFEGPLHRSLTQKFDAGPGFRWMTLDTGRYADHRAHLEFTALSPDFAVSQVIVAARMPGEPGETEVTQAAVRAAIERFAMGTMSDALDAAVIAELLHRSDSPGLKKIATSLHADQKRIVGEPKRSHVAAAMWDGSGVMGHVAMRGNPKLRGEEAPRRLPEALVGPAGLTSAGSGRLEIAHQLTDPANPLVARVIVNRVWHHLFGRGLVASVDNFGVLGEMPTHPELLDYLADRFVRDGWSLKKLIRNLVLTRTYQQASLPRTDAAAADPQNKLLHRGNLKRLEGEAIRDALLCMSGRLDTTMFGPPVATHLTAFMDGRGKPKASGPLDGAGRRSIYLEVRRNFQSPLFAAFDTPTPFTTIGRRTVSNVPAQALMLLNDPFVREQSQRWAARVTKDVTDADTRIDRLYRDAFARPATDVERAACRKFVDANSWDDLAHALVNVKEFIYIH